MYNTLLLKAFEKAGEEIHTTSTRRRAVHLSDVILEYSGMPYGRYSDDETLATLEKEARINKVGL